jgi:hypothetical protein
MRFISNGDYIFPFQWPAYWAQHIYIWSYQHGAANPDGIMRLPGRLLDLLVFAAFGNLAIGYFYVLSCLIITFLAFLWFARSFLGAQRMGIGAVGALFFACNPIFLGNLSKVGLILAVAMLPVCFVALKKAFTEKRLRYVLLFIAALNVSMLHPFTFSVNLIVSGIYLIYLMNIHRAFIRDNLGKLVLMALLALLLNAYMLLPLVSLGTVDKGALSDTVTSAPVDYTSLVDIANTGDIFTGLSLSKGVLKDYDFYGARTWPFYFLGVFLFYAIMFGIYIRVERRAKPADRRRFMIALGLFLLLLVLSTATYLHADVLIKLLIGLPGGWMFRSPLKWQLYMPLTLFTALVVALKYTRDGWRLKMLYGTLGLTFVLMNGYLFTQVYHRLLTPRSLTYFQGLQQTNLDHKQLLFINADRCALFARDHPGMATELNQIFISNTVQVKRVDTAQLDAVALNQYDYIMGCKGTLDTPLLTESYNFKLASTFSEGNYELYKNASPEPFAHITSQVFALAEPGGLGGKYQLATKTLKQPFVFTADDNGLPAVGLQDAFDTITPGAIKDSTLASSLSPAKNSKQTVYIAHDASLYYRAQDDRLQLFATPVVGAQPLPAGSNTPLSVSVPVGKTLRVTYNDPAFTFNNQIPNPSFESGAWQKQVGDCNAYDEQPGLRMAIAKSTASKGSQSLELGATKHIACTSPENITVHEGEHYLLSFDYQALGGRYAGYYINFNDQNQTSSSERLDDTKAQWKPITTELVVPEGATKLHLLLYAYPANLPGLSGKARYDNFKLVRIPAIKNKVFVLDGLPTPTPAAAATQSTLRNPTKTLLHVHSPGAEPFYLSVKESFNHLWRLSLNDGSHGLSSLVPKGANASIGTQVRMNGSMNGWYIDPASVCTGAHAGCVQHSDGSYDIALVMEFAPQRWFYVGCLISLATVAGIGAFFVIDWHRNRKGRTR